MAELKLYVPLLVHLNEPGMPFNTLNELEEENGAYHTDVISEAVKKSMETYGDRGLAVKMEGIMGEKIISAMPGVEEHNGASPVMQETPVGFLGQEDPLEKG